MKQQIWSSLLVEENIKQIEKGFIFSAKQSPFFEGKQGLRKADLTFSLTDHELDEYIKCKEDLLYFAENYCYVKNEKGRIEKIKLRPYQITILQNYSNYRFGILMASRQSGKTITAAITLLHAILFTNNLNTLVTANKLDTSIEIIDKIQNIYMLLPFFLQQGLEGWNQKNIIFENGSKIKGTSTTKNSSIGFAYQFIYMDEFAHVDNTIAEKFYKSVFPTLTSFENSRMIITSTPNGVNLFHKILTDAERPVGDPLKNNFKAQRCYWWETENRFVCYLRLDLDKLHKNNLTKEEVFDYFNSKYPNNKVKMEFNEEIGKHVIFVYNNEYCKEEDVEKEEINGISILRFCELTTWKKETIKDIGGISAFNQEYNLRFITDSKSLFSEETLDYLMSKKKEFIPYSHEAFSKLRFDYSDLKFINDYEIFNPANRKKETIILSVDMSEGLGQDYSVINIFKVKKKSTAIIDKYKSTFTQISDFFSLQQIGIYRSNIITVSQMSELLYLLAYEFFDENNVKIVLELNGPGSTLLYEMPHLFNGDNNYGKNIFFKYKHRMDSLEEKSGLKVNSNKNEMVRDYQTFLECEDIILHEEDTLQEISTFIKHNTTAGNLTFKADGGNHDDLVMTIVNVTTVFKKQPYKDMVEDLYQLMKDDALKIVIDSVLGSSEKRGGNDYKSFIEAKNRILGNRGMRNLFE